MSDYSPFSTPKSSGPGKSAKERTGQSLAELDARNDKEDAAEERREAREKARRERKSS